MQKTILNQPLEVCLLIADIKEAQKIARIFRKTGVIPYVYQNLHEFWQGIIQTPPTLALVDVNLMSDKTTNLRNHPLVKNGGLNLCFYYTPETAPLLLSTYDIFNFGTILKSERYQGQLKSILWRLNKTIDLQRDQYRRRVAQEKLDKNLNASVALVEEFKEKKYYQDSFHTLCDLFEKEKQGEDFYSICEKVFGRWEAINEFAYLELSPNGQKLTSPPSESAKIRVIPSLWLGQPCTRGIEYFAQTMANQVCLELMGIELMSLQIKGINPYPDKLIFVRPNDENFMNRFPWDALEKYLSGLYCYFEYRNIAPQVISGWSSPYDFLGQLDHYLYAQQAVDVPAGKSSSEEYLLFDLDFSKMVDFVQSKKIRFYWKNFWQDFSARLETLAKGSQVSTLGPRHIGLLLSREKNEHLFTTLKDFVTRFPLWRYFEDADLVLAEDLKPTVRMVPLSSQAYIRMMDEQNIQRLQEKGQTLLEELNAINTRQAKSSIRPTRPISQ
jgi:hypothetical protein